MQGNVLELLLTKPWLLLIAVFCLGLSIFVHELGHYLAARWRGLYAPRFSIGFGRKIWSWTDRHGTEFRLSWIPVGGYVALPQLADMGSLEGGEGEEAKPLPPIGYLDKVFVAIAGAVFNLIFAVLLGTILWGVGQDVATGSQSTEVGYVMQTITRSDGEKVPSPAAVAGVQVGDVIRSIDGREVRVWGDVLKGLIYGSGRTEEGARTAQFVIERNGKRIALTLYPELATKGKVRRIGIGGANILNVQSVAGDKPAARAGFQAGDKLLRVDGIAIRSEMTLVERLTATPPSAHSATVLRAGREQTFEIPAGILSDKMQEWGAEWIYDTTRIHNNPVEQVWNQITESLETLWIVINPRSDVRATDMGGPLEIVRQFVFAADDGVFTLIYFVLLINVALAVFNLMPIPVLDGGHVVFATIAKLRGRPIPPNIVASIQTVFLVLLLSLMLYVLTNDVRRIARDAQPAAEEDTPKPPAEPPAPAKP
jgi:regulator of sigma E protease